MGDKVNTTLSIDEGIKLDFKLACTRNFVDMSETVESFMKHYSDTTEKLRNERKSKEEEK